MSTLFLQNSNLKVHCSYIPWFLSACVPPAFLLYTKEKELLCFGYCRHSDVVPEEIITVVIQFISMQNMLQKYYWRFKACSYNATDLREILTSQETSMFQFNNNTKYLGINIKRMKVELEWKLNQHNRIKLGIKTILAQSSNQTLPSVAFHALIYFTKKTDLSNILKDNNERGQSTLFCAKPIYFNKVITQKCETTYENLRTIDDKKIYLKKREKIKWNQAHVDDIFTTNHIDIHIK